MILLARHGETDENRPPQRVQGQGLDPALNERGRAQAAALGRELLREGEPIAALWTSDLRRSAQTAEIVGRALGLAPRADARLRESDRGRWQGRLLDEIQRAEPDAWIAFRRAEPGFRFPGGESLEEHRARVVAALAEIAAGPLPALVVTHGGSVRCALAHASPHGLAGFHLVGEVPNASVVRVHPSDYLSAPAAEGVC